MVNWRAAVSLREHTGIGNMFHCIPPAISIVMRAARIKNLIERGLLAADPGISFLSAGRQMKIVLAVILVIRMARARAL